MVEIRSERLDYLRVYDYGREPGGFVRANQVRRLTLAAEEAPELLAIIGFVRDTPSSEALGSACRRFIRRRRSSHQRRCGGLVWTRWGHSPTAWRDGRAAANQARCRAALS
jgi:hypothetical protein